MIVPLSPWQILLMLGTIAIDLLLDQPRICVIEGERKWIATKSDNQSKNVMI